MRIRAILLTLAVLSFSVPARCEPAATLDAAWELYRNGRFVESETLALGIESPDAFALAARAANVRALYLVPIDERAAILERARQHGEAALALDPWHVEGALQLVIALGQSARLMNPVDAYVEGVAGAAKKLLDRLERRASGNPYYHAVVGAWHGELVIRAGPIAARAFYGARWELAAHHYDKARALAPRSIVIGSEYAKMLLSRGHQSTKAVDLLRTVVTATPSDAADALVVEEAKILLHGASTESAPR